MKTNIREYPKNVLFFEEDLKKEPYFSLFWFLKGKMEHKVVGDSEDRQIR